MVEKISIKEHLDYIFHGTGSINSKTIREKPLDIIIPNIMGLINCCDLCRSNSSDNENCRLIVFSSATVYGTIKYRDIRINEKTTFAESLDDEIISYSESKRMSEVIAMSMYKQFNMDIVVASFSYVYGYADFKPNTALFQFMQALKNDCNIIINNPQACRRDNIYIDDAIRGVIALAKMG